MKKVLFSALLTVLVTVSSFATGHSERNATAVHLFETDFKEATNARWTSNANYLQVTFTLHGKKMDAFYDLDGGFIGTSSKMPVDDLPVNAKRSLARKWAGYTVKDAIKFDTTNETAYYVSAENETGSVFLKVTSFGL